MRRPDVRSLVLLPVLLAAGPGLAIAQGPLAADAGAEAGAGSPLATPAVLADRSPEPGVVVVDLVARAERLTLRPGAETEVYAYNGTVPGPTLEVREGDRVVVRFRNELPEETTVHWHGLHLPFAADGSPFHPVAPGETYEYAFTVRPGSAGTYWYHPHPNHRTGVQVARGLYGAVVVRAADDPLAGIPERLVILSDNRLRADGSIDIPDPHSHAGRTDFENGREGDLLFVTGAVLPTVRIRPGEVQRWRVINASAGRYYRLALSGGQRFLHVGGDGGLFERPVETPEVVLATADRVELLVRGQAPGGDPVVLQALPYDRYIPQTRPADWDSARDLLVLETHGPAAAPAAIPATLRAIPRLDPAEATATRVMVLTQGMINGQLMDMSRVDVSAPLGATEIWQVENLVGLDHPFHLHGFQFQVLDRDGVPEPFAAWEDVVNVPKHQTVRFIVRYENYPGKWMFHCHILDHEDHGMMGVLEVR